MRKRPKFKNKRTKLRFRPETNRKSNGTILTLRAFKKHR